MRQSAAVAEPRCLCPSSFLVGVKLLLIVATSVVSMPLVVRGQGSSDAATSAYADAANFQTGGATDVAIDAWNSFLKKYPRDPLASNAAHYLGVCYMQKENPDYTAAAESFSRALRSKKYDLREESLANAGWCYYASSGEGQDRDTKSLQQALDTFATLRKEYPKSRYLDRAYFYSGEVAYALRNTQDAIRFYDQLLSAPAMKDSPLRCDAFYARGVALEETKQYDKAIASFNQLLAGCEQKKELVIDVQMRLGDLGILRKKYDDAVKAFDDVLRTSTVSDDQAYALFRQGYALAQSNRPAEAAAKYETLLKKHPRSQYAAASTLASAQSSYRSGELDLAAERFQRVLNGSDETAATEAAHWLARIAISKQNPAEAIRICKKQIEAGTRGEYAVALKLDLGEALSLDPDSVAESLDVFERAYRDAPQDPLAPRALYNAAFSAYQIGEPKNALRLALEFIQRFPRDTLVPDIRFVAAECQFQTGKTDDSINTFRRLLETTGKDDVQRPIWVLRAATAANGAKKYDDTIEILNDNLDSLKQPAQKAEAYFLIGRAQLGAGKSVEAASSFAASNRADPSWKRAGEARLFAGQAALSSGQQQEAIRDWQRLIDESPETRMADQARYKLAQLSAKNLKFRDAVGRYDAILDSGKDKSLIPYALYEKGWALMQLGEYQTALPPLSRVLQDHKNHAVQNDAILARGITLRNLGRGDEAKVDLESYLAVPPTGINLGHSLYELALIDQQEKSPAKAAERLERLVREVPDYPAMDKVLYELGWSYRESGNDKKAIEFFNRMIDRYSDTPLASEAAYYVGQQYYAAGNWQQAANKFEVATNSKDQELSEKAFYRLGWSKFKMQDYKASEQAFARQAANHRDGKLTLDALMMIGECHFRKPDYQQALQAFQTARDKLRADNDNAQTVRDRSERQVRELILLHGGQSAGQLKQWQDSISWLAELRQRFPATSYLPQAFYETGFAYQQLGDKPQALKFFGEVANNYRNESAARARFMMGEIHFGQNQYDKAIPEFQRVMFGFGAEKSPPTIQNWQAKSGFEAGRCSELLMQKASTPDKRDKAKKLAQTFYTYVIEKHPDHELAAKSRQRLEAVNK